MAGVGSIAAIGAADDPRIDVEGLDQSTYPTGVLEKLHDPSIPLEEYIHYAKITRAEEDRLYGPGSGYSEGPNSFTRFYKKWILHKPVERVIEKPRLSISAQGEGEILKPVSGSDGDSGEKGAAANESKFEPIIISDEEWVTASRAARTATWGAVFYLITTDILGPFSTGYAYSKMGLGPGVTLFTIFGALAFYSGLQLWKLFLQLDSDRYPLKGYGDIAFRVYGSWFRHTCNGLQSFQFFLNVAMLILTCAQSISQLTKSNLCFIVCMVICTIVGLVVGQIRTLQRFGWLASVSVYLNLFVIFATMGVMAHSPPNYELYAAQGYSIDLDDPAPIVVSASAPAGLNLWDNVNGLMNAVFAYGGATLFTELMAEMRRPFDFWKGLLAADLLIYLCYMVYGIYCYCMQGQYVYNVSYQGISPYTWQTVCNILELITGIIAAVLYGNIGIKVLYNNVGRDLFKWPRLETKTGKWIWFFFVPGYWIVAWIVSQSIPQISSWTAVVGAGAILQFTYTFPPFLMLGFKIQRDAITEGDTYDPATRTATHVDHGLKRWIRGFKKELWWNLFDVVYYIGSFVTAILGLVSGFMTMADAYKDSSNLQPWTCESPTG